MLLNRRLRLLYICTAGMDAVVFTPFLLLTVGAPFLWRVGMAPAQPPILAPLIWLWPCTLAAIFVLEVLNRTRLGDRAYFVATFGLMTVTTLLAVRFALHPSAGLGDWAWVRNTADTIFNFHRGLRPESVIVAAALFVWQRAIGATSRGIHFFRVGMGFRIGVLLLFLGGGLLSGFFPLYRDSSVMLLWIYFGLGLIAVAVSRLDDKSKDALTSKGALMPSRMLAAVVLTAGSTVGLMALFATGFTPENIRRAIGWFNPLWQWIGSLLVRLLALLFLLLTPVFDLLERFFLLLMANSSLGDALRQLAQNQPTEETSQQLEQVQALPEWLFAAIRYGVVSVVLLVVLFVILIFLARVQARLNSDEQEDVGRADLRLDGNFMQRGLDRLREMARLMGRYRFGTQLLAAITVQNMYANLTRIAKRRGFPRRPAQPPDEYLPVLAKAFPGQIDALGRLTSAYMRVHYGDRPISREELRHIRRDYQTVQDALPPAEEAAA